jgi:plastocyanin
VVVLLVIALVGTFVAGLHQTSVDNRKLLISETAAPTTFTALAGIPPTGGAIHEYPAFFPALIKIHAGDTIAFTNPTADVPHSVTFGVAPNHSNQPVFESGPAGPIPVVVAPCATDTPLTQQTRTCAAPSTAAALPPFSGQAFYSSGIIAPQQQFLLRTASTLAAGTYHYVCLIHANQTGTIVVEPRGTPTQLAQTLDDNAQKQQHHDASVLANLQPPVPRAGTVQAGVTGPETSLNQFFPASIQIRAGDSVTWTNNGGTPHVIIFDGYVDPNTATFSPPTAASGSDYTGGLFHTYLIGSPPYFSTTFALRFTQTGIYTYICSLHPGMGGTVIVHN